MKEEVKLPKGKRIILIRGHSGSGKSTVAGLIEQLCDGIGVHIEADMFRTNLNGEYEFVPNVDEPLIKCLDTAKLILDNGKVPIVANTSLTEKRIRPYLDLVGEDNLLVIRTTGDYNNIHNVPEESIKKQKKILRNYPGEIVGVTELTVSLAVTFAKGVQPCTIFDT